MEYLVRGSLGSLILMLSACGPGLIGGVDIDSVEQLSELASALEDGVLPGEHRVFVTAAVWTANLGGLDGADAKCQDRADSSGLTKSYKAILSTSTVNAKDRLTIEGPIYNFSDETTRILIAEDADALWNTGSQDLEANILYSNAYGTTGESNVWTGTDSNGEGDGFDCSGWTTFLTSPMGGGRVGTRNESDSDWTDTGTTGCNNHYRLYCISQ